MRPRKQGRRSIDVPRFSIGNRSKPWRPCASLDHRQRRTWAPARSPSGRGPDTPAQGPLRCRGSRPMSIVTVALHAGSSIRWGYETLTLKRQRKNALFSQNTPREDARSSRSAYARCQHRAPEERHGPERIVDRNRSSPTRPAPGELRASYLAQRDRATTPWATEKDVERVIGAVRRALESR